MGNLNRIRISLGNFSSDIFLPPAARITDMHTCPMVVPGTPPVPHVGGPVTSGVPTVLVGGLAAARITDISICTPVGIPDPIVSGSASVLIAGMSAARLGDTTAHGGLITTGCATVLIGNSGYFETGRGGPAANGRASSGSFSPESLLSGQGLTAPQRQARTLRKASAQGAPFIELCRG